MNRVLSIDNEVFADCQLCGHKCGINRAKRPGYCGVDGQLYVASVYRHYGEEPVLGGRGGVCNVFFAHCNMQCIYCQNGQISCNRVPLLPHSIGPRLLIREITEHLSAGCDTLGFVSPTPYVPWVRLIVQELRASGYRPTVVYNTNGYDSPSALLLLEGLVDIYLPDYKYGSYALAQRLSGVKDYPDVALECIKGMVAQVGLRPQYDENGVCRRGVIVRHMVLPGEVENSRAALLNLVTDISNELTLSLLGQYTPAYLRDGYGQLDRPLTQGEYDAVRTFMEELGFTHGWTQELSSSGHYKPDFTRDDPFAPNVGEG